jgi:hypothetical protein
MHEKHRLAEGSFAELLGATVFAPEHLDTDQFGTFAGDIPRTLSPYHAALVKARLAMQISGAPSALASEGSFTSLLGLGVENTELLLFIDSERGLELVESSTMDWPLPAGGPIHSVAEAVAFADAVGFPAQGLTLRADDGVGISIVKDIPALDDLTRHVEHGLGAGSTVTLIADYRAHRSPLRAHRIRALCERMALRLATPCPRCASPGFGRVAPERGVPCAQCGRATELIAADIDGCGVCGHQLRRPRALTVADPGHCDHCNP